jgi:hypothetical protein
VDARHELSSEAGYKGARERTFPLTAIGYTFHDKIISVDYSPGDVEFTPMRKDGTLMDHFGRPCMCFKKAKRQIPNTFY